MAYKIITVTKVGGGSVNINEASINLVLESGSGSAIRYRVDEESEKLITVTEAPAAIEAAGSILFPVTDLVSASPMWLNANKVVSFGDINSKAKIVYQDGVVKTSYFVDETSAAVKALINAL